jgi:glucose/arabinose dehydrogenase
MLPSPIPLRTAMGPRSKRYRDEPGSCQAGIVLRICLALFLSVILASAAGADDPPTAKAKKPKEPKPPAVARRDPSGQAFRRTPMNAAVRSVVVPLTTNVHLAFDTDLFRVHSVWKGEPLNLYGTPYSASKERYFSDFDGKPLWTAPGLFPWAAGRIPATDQTERPEGSRFLGISTRGGRTTFSYELPLAGGKTVTIRETAGCPLPDEPWTIVRRFELSSAGSELFLLAYAGEGKLEPASGPGVNIVGSNTSLRLSHNGGRAGAVWRPNVAKADYVEKRWVEKKGDSSIERTEVKGDQARVWLSIPSHDRDIAIEIAYTVLHAQKEFPEPDAKKSAKGTPPARNVDLLPPPAEREIKAATRPPESFSADPSVPLIPSGDAYYRLEKFPLPKEIALQVTGMDFMPNGDLAVSTWTGEIYIVQGAQGNVKAVTYRRFARGLNEPLGLRVIKGDIYVVQKCELSRVRDTDGDGEADFYECVCQDWGHTGNYHDFSFGPLTDKAGNLYVYRNGNHGIYEVPYMGWVLKISPDGRKTEGFASGLRSPNGYDTYGPDRDLFVTDNQGNWIGACTLTHVQRGRFYGFPSTTPSPIEQFKKPDSFSPPAVWFPYKMARSSSGMATIADERFGPFQGQMLVGDFQNAIVTRVALEKINGEWQGAVWPMLKGFGSGVNRINYGPDGKLYVGGCKNRAWPALGPNDYALERVAFTGKTPFEVKSAHALPDGFELRFTAPVEEKTASNPEGYDVSQYRYQYHETYGSPEVGHDGKPDSATEIKVSKATVSPDGLSVRLKLEGHRSGFVTSVRALDVTNRDGAKLWHDTFYYTLNQIPAR